MGEVLRKDYGSGAIVDHSQETMKRINHINSPYSVQATGHDKRLENVIKLTSDSLDELDEVEGIIRALVGNREGIVTEITMTSDGESEPTFGPPLVSIGVTYLQPTGAIDTNEDYVQDDLVVTYTKAEILASEVILLVSP